MLSVKRTLAALLATLMLASTLAACSEDTAETPVDTTAAAVEDTTTAETEPPETERSDAKDNLPAGLKFNGTTVTWVYRNEDWYRKWDMVGTDNTGELIQDAIWQRNINVEDRLDVKLNMQGTQGKALADVQSELKNLVFAGTDDIDIISSTLNTTATVGLYPFLYELTALKYVDISQPWWREEGTKELSMDGEHYRFLFGDHTLNTYLKCGVVYYNKDIYTDVYKTDADELYKDVLGGTWTYDDMIRMTSEAYVDLNGDGKQNQGDRFGLMIPAKYTEATMHMVYGCDIDGQVRTKEGGVDLAPFNSEKNIAVIDKLIKVCHNEKGVWISDASIDASPKYFVQNNSLMYTGRLTNAVAANMRDMESDYGILPMPKYDENQEEYITMIHTSGSTTCVPKSLASTRVDMVDAVLEAMASESYRVVMTPFIETALKLKYSRDSLSGSVIDIVFDSARVFFSDAFAKNMNSIINNCFLKNITNGENTFASSIASALASGQTQINDYIKNIKDSDK